MSLRRLLVVHITLQQSLSDRSPACSLETPSSEDDHEGRRTYLVKTYSYSLRKQVSIGLCTYQIWSLCSATSANHWINGEFNSHFLILSVLRKKEKEISYITQKNLNSKGVSGDALYCVHVCAKILSPLLFSA